MSGLGRGRGISNKPAWMTQGLAHQEEERSSKKRRRSRSRSPRKHKKSSSSKSRKENPESSSRRKSSRKSSKRRRRSDSDSLSYHSNNDEDSKRRSHKHRSSRKHHKTSRDRKYSSRYDDSEEDKRSRRRKRSRSRERKSKEKDRKISSKSSSHPTKLSTTAPVVAIDKAKVQMLLGSKANQKPKFTLDSDKDYFQYNSHLRVYLLIHKQLHFEDLSSEETHYQFKNFCEEFNDGKLETCFYKEKLPDEVLEAFGRRTQHSWGFKTSKTENDVLNGIKASVKASTSYTNGKELVTSRSNCLEGQHRSGANGQMDDHETRARQRLERRRAEKQLQERMKVGQEEIYGVETKKHGRDKQLEVKRQTAQAIHGASKQKEEAMMGGVEISDSQMYGGDGDDFQSALAKERRLKEKLSNRKAERLNELQQKEDSKKEEMLKRLGLDNIAPGTRISIQPRK